MWMNANLYLCVNNFLFSSLLQVTSKQSKSEKQ